MESFFAEHRFVGAKLARINKCLSIPEIVARPEKDLRTSIGK
jgi:hypothetical protein